MVLLFVSALWEQFHPNKFMKHWLPCKRCLKSTANEPARKISCLRISWYSRQ